MNRAQHVLRDAIKPPQTRVAQDCDRRRQICCHQPVQPLRGTGGASKGCAHCHSVVNRYHLHSTHTNSHANTPAHSPSICNRGVECQGSAPYRIAAFSRESNYLVHLFQGPGNTSASFRSRNAHSIPERSRPPGTEPAPRAERVEKAPCAIQRSGERAIGSNRRGSRSSALPRRTPDRIQTQKRSEEWNASDRLASARNE